MTKILQPGGWWQPQGYSNGVLATGRYIAVAGQIGWNEAGDLVADDFVSQAAQALRNIVAVVAEGGGKPEHIVRLTWYVTDKLAYSNNSKELGERYREIMGAHYPAMTLIEVKSLLEDEAVVEIEATAIVPE
ncbi:MAG: enamine deaminase RidA [Candidatus Meridianibacter frigidus]|nr:MAG: enamine deaminase RidA [Candidatus Eremiobacteraeota bacterium]